MNPVHTLTPSFLMPNLILYSHFCLFTFGFPTRMLYEFLISQCMIHVLPIPSSFFDHLNNTRWRAQIIKLSVRHFSPSSFYLPPLWFKYSLTAWF
jgi:hypothetical protein